MQKHKASARFSAAQLRRPSLRRPSHDGAPAPASGSARKRVGAGSDTRALKQMCQQNETIPCAVCWSTAAILCPAHASVPTQQAGETPFSATRERRHGEAQNEAQPLSLQPSDSTFTTNKQQQQQLSTHLHRCCCRWNVAKLAFELAQSLIHGVPLFMSAGGVGTD